MAAPYHGSCFCGAVQISVSGEPVAMGSVHGNLRELEGRVGRRGWKMGLEGGLGSISSARRGAAVALAAAAWFNAEALEDQPAEPPLDARIQEMCDRYAEIIRREQALLSRRFSDNELRLVADVLRSTRFETAESCRGLWLAVESRVLHDELDRQYEVDGEALLERLKTLGYTQEVALIEALSPVR